MHTHDRTHTPTTQPTGAGHSRNPSPARTPTQHTPARKGGVQAGRAHKHTHAPTAQAGVARRGSNPGPTTQPRTAPPTRRCRRACGTGTQAHTHLNTTPRSGGAQPKPGPQHARQNRTPEPERAGCRRSAHTATHVRNLLTKKGGVQAETKAQPQTRQTAAGRGGAKPHTVPKHTHPRPQPGLPKPKPKHNPDPKHKHNTTIGNPVSIARALRQPVPCR